MPETTAELAADSRWPAFFPSPICLVSTTDGRRAALERVVGPSIVNRFPYIAALSFCVRPLSLRHHPRSTFAEILDGGGRVAIQFLPPGYALDRAMQAVRDVPEQRSWERIAASGLPTRAGVSHEAPVFSDAYLVYEGTLASPSVDVQGNPVLKRPWADVGSHRVYFFEIEALQLRADIAQGSKQIYWRSLPSWHPSDASGLLQPPAGDSKSKFGFIKGYTPHYRFPSAGTVAFAPDFIQDGMAIKRLPRMSTDELRKLSNDETRWPCYFPCSVGMITSWREDGVPNLIPCGSTAVVSRQPMVIAPCISYSSINQRYAQRASLEIIREAGAFNCGVPYLGDSLVRAIAYAGNVSIGADREKLLHAGVYAESGRPAPLLPALPIQFECRLAGEIPLGTHVMLLGEVRSILVRDDVGPKNPLEWYPWADIVEGDAHQP